MKKHLLTAGLILMPAICFADRLGGLRAGAEVALSTQIVTGGNTNYVQVDPASVQSGSFNITGGTLTSNTPLSLVGTGGSSNSRLRGLFYPLPRSGGFGPQTQDLVLYHHGNMDSGTAAPFYLISSTVQPSLTAPQLPPSGTYSAIKLDPITNDGSVDWIANGSVLLRASNSNFLVQTPLQFSTLDCTGNTNSGKLTADGTGVISCADDISGGSSSLLIATGTFIGVASTITATPTAISFHGGWFQSLAAGTTAVIYMNRIESTAAAAVPLTMVQASGQTGDMFRLRSSADAMLGALHAGGRLSLGSSDLGDTLNVYNGRAHIRRDSGDEFIYLARGGVRAWTLSIDSTDGSLAWITDGTGAAYDIRAAVGQTTIPLARFKNASSVTVATVTTTGEIASETGLVKSTFTVTGGTISANGIPYRFPNTRGGANQVLSTDGAESGVQQLSWATPSGGSGSAVNTSSFNVSGGLVRALSTTEVVVATITITPLSTSAKVFVHGRVNVAKDAGTTARLTTLNLRRGGLPVPAGNVHVTTQSVVLSMAVANSTISMVTSGIDAPNSVSLTTYTLTMLVGAGASTVTAVEFSAFEIAPRGEQGVGASTQTEHRSFPLFKSTNGWTNDESMMWDAPLESSIRISSITASTLSTTASTVTFRIEYRAPDTPNTAGTNVFTQVSTATWTRRIYTSPSFANPVVPAGYGLHFIGVGESGASATQIKITIYYKKE